MANRTHMTPAQERKLGDFCWANRDLLASGNISQQDFREKAQSHMGPAIFVSRARLMRAVEAFDDPPLTVKWDRSEKELNFLSSVSSHFSPASKHGITIDQLATAFVAFLEHIREPVPEFLRPFSQPPLPPPPNPSSRATPLGGLSPRR